MVADCKAFQILQALEPAQNFQHRPAAYVHPESNEVADHFEFASGCKTFGHSEANSPTSIGVVYASFYRVRRSSVPESLAARN